MAETAKAPETHRKVDVETAAKENTEFHDGMYKALCELDMIDSDFTGTVVLDIAKDTTGEKPRYYCKKFKCHPVFT